MVLNSFSLSLPPPFPAVSRWPWAVTELPEGVSHAQADHLQGKLCRVGPVRTAPVPSLVL